jgi:hypothetical protein
VITMVRVVQPLAQVAGAPFERFGTGHGGTASTARRECRLGHREQVER